MHRATQALVILLGSLGSAAWAAAPVLVAPGAAGKTLVANSACPTFSWGARSADHDLELLVFPVAAGRSLGETPVLRVRLPAGATAWTPSAERCLAPGDYAWSLRVDGAGGGGAGDALFFTIEVDAVAEIRRLKKMVEELSQRAQPGIVEVSQTSGAVSLPAAPALSTWTVDGIGGDTPVVLAACSGVFTDVAADLFCPWIEAAYADGFLQACASEGGNVRFCPDNAVTREQAAVFVERLRNGSAGGALSGNYPNPDLAPAFSLPQSCVSGALAEWNGSAWICSCGSPGKACCAGATCVAGALCNISNVCVVCGSSGEPCCAGDVCNPGGVCSAGSCAPCGGLGQLCCAGDSCDPGGVCSVGMCQACGQAGQLCCAGNSCTAGTICSGGTCAVCGDIGQPCCAGNSCNAGTCNGGVCAP